MQTWEKIGQKQHQQIKVENPTLTRGLSWKRVPNGYEIMIMMIMVEHNQKTRERARTGCVARVPGPCRVCQQHPPLPANNWIVIHYDSLFFECKIFRFRIGRPRRRWPKTITTRGYLLGYGPEKTSSEHHQSSSWWTFELVVVHNAVPVVGEEHCLDYSWNWKCLQLIMERVQASSTIHQPTNCYRTTLEQAIHCHCHIAPFPSKCILLISP